MKLVLLAVVSLFSVYAVHAQTDMDAAGSLDSLLSLPINTVSKSWQTVKVAPSSVTIFTDRDIQRFGYRTLEDVLRATRGFYTSYDRNYSYIGVRGFSRPADYNNRLLVLMNGHYLNENVYGSAGFGNDFPLNMDAVERIEIVRGPGSAVYGTGAMFAVINVVTKGGQHLDGVSAAAEVGSFGYRQAQLYTGSVLDNGLNLSMFAVAGTVDGEDQYYPEFDTDSTDGIARGLDGADYYSLFGRVNYDVWSLQTYYSFRRKDIPTASFDMAFNHPGTETRDIYGIVEARYDDAVAEQWNLLVRANFNVYDYTGLYLYPEENPDSSTNVWVGAEAQLRWDVMDNNRIFLGLEYKNNLRVDYRYSYDGEPVFDHDEPYTVLSGYLQDEYQAFDNFNITAGLRLDHNSATGTSLSPRLGLIYNPTAKTTLKLLYGTAFRSPNFNELYVMFPEESKGNPALKPERITTYEIVAEQQIGSDLYAVASLYDNRMTNLIDQQTDPEDSMLQFRNVASSRAVGVEFELNARFPWLRAYASWSYQSAVDEETDNTLSNSPGHLFKAGAVVEPVHSVSVAFTAVYETARETVYETETDPFLLTSVHVMYRPMEAVEFSVLVRNALDTTYALPGGFEHRQRSIPQDGRSVAAKVRFVL